MLLIIFFQKKKKEEGNNPGAAQKPRERSWERGWSNPTQNLSFVTVAQCFKMADEKKKDMIISSEEQIRQHCCCSARILNIKIMFSVFSLGKGKKLR